MKKRASKVNKARLHKMKLVLWVSLFLGFSTSALAQKLNFDFGFYSIAAKAPSDSAVATKDVKLSGPGSYSLSANFELRKPFEIGVGYSVFFSKGISGDMGFGPDFYGYYFPYSNGSAVKFESAQLSYKESEQIRPFVYFSFHQRQFQSVQSSFSGFGFGGGAEYEWSEQYTFRATIRSMTLTGPSKAQFDYMDFLFGIQQSF